MFRSCRTGDRPVVASANSPDRAAPEVHFIQTFSFAGKLSPKAEAVLAALKKKYPEIKTLADVTPAVGIANAYDAMHLTAIAIAQGRFDRRAENPRGVRAIDKYDGLIKNYNKPFSPTEPRRADLERLPLHPLQGRSDTSSDELK